MPSLHSCFHYCYQSIASVLYAMSLLDYHPVRPSIYSFVIYPELSPVTIRDTSSVVQRRLCISSFESYLQIQYQKEHISSLKGSSLSPAHLSTSPVGLQVTAARLYLSLTAIASSKKKGQAINHVASHGAHSDT